MVIFLWTIIFDGRLYKNIGHIGNRARKVKGGLDSLEKIYDLRYSDNLSLTPDREENRLDTVEAIKVADISIFVTS